MADPVGIEHELEEQSNAIQKGVGIVDVLDAPPGGYSPDDTLEYTLDFQISDYFAFEDLVITDVFSDGQEWDCDLSPTLTCERAPWRYVP